MAVNSRTYVRILPESTGDRLQFKHSFDIEYSTKLINLSVGKIIVGATSGVRATIRNDLPDNDIAGAGVLSVNLDVGYEAKSYIVGEVINIEGVPACTVTDNYCLYVPTSTLVSYDNPKFGQRVDKSGSAFARFTEGSVQFDAFGKMQTSEQFSLFEMLSVMDTNDEHFSDLLVGAGTITHDPLQSATLFTCTTGATDGAHRSSNFYIPYTAGFSQLTEMTVALGDTGKANVRRRWGYFDDNDGIYFEMDGLQLKVVQRSSVTGVVVNTEVIQTDFSGDTLDGSEDVQNPTDALLDVSKDNIYWIDLQWLGAGRVRMGVVLGGERIVMHQFDNANIHNGSYMKRGALPIHFAQANFGSAASTSEMRVFCATVKTEGIREIEEALHGHFTEKGGQVVTATTGTWLPSLSIRPKLTWNGLNNYGYLVPKTLSVTGIDTSTLGDARIKIEIFKNTVLTAPTWVDRGDLSQIDISATGMTGGEAVAEFFIKGTDNIDLSNFFAEITDFINNTSDLTTQNILTVAFKKLDATPVVEALCALTWKELKI